ncbi:MAG: hypothetical protein CMI55_01240 [Parcubacteria group bacterium]|nr:hypothetical protein [Parcubacteria group bacterium]
MDEAWLKGLRNKLRVKAPTIEADGIRQSRRVSGQYSYVVEKNAYHSVICYVQKGLGKENEIIETVIKIILGIQASARLTNYYLHPFSFGWDDNKLHHRKSAISIIARVSSAMIINELCKLAGSELSGTSIIPALFPPTSLYSKKSNVRGHDLLVFICKDRSVQLSELSTAAYNRVRRRSLWIFINNDKPEWEFGTFKPEVAGDSQKET